VHNALQTMPVKTDRNDARGMIHPGHEPASPADRIHPFRSNGPDR
jgi:hypothetical protein